MNQPKNLISRIVTLEDERSEVEEESDYLKRRYYNSVNQCGYPDHGVIDRMNDLHHKDKILKNEIKILEKAAPVSLNYGTIRPRNSSHERRASLYNSRQYNKGMPIR